MNAHWWTSVWARQWLKLFSWSHFGRSCYLFKICLGLLIKSFIPILFFQSWVYLLTRFLYGNYEISCTAELTQNKESGLGCAEIEDSKSPGMLHGPPGSAAVCPVFFGSKIQFSLSPHGLGDSKGPHEPQNFGFLTCDTWPNLLISVASKRLEKYQTGWTNYNHQTHTGNARSRSETTLDEGTRMYKNIEFGRRSQFLKWHLVYPQYISEKFQKYFLGETTDISELSCTDNFRGYLLCGPQNEI